MDHIDLEDRFLVINRKRVEELNTLWEGEGDHPAVHVLNHGLKLFSECYKEIVGHGLDQQYIVVNRDEPYAEEVLELVTKHEKQKERGKTDDTK